MEKKSKEAAERKRINDKLIADIKYRSEAKMEASKKKSNRHKYTRLDDNVLLVLFS